MGQSDQKPPSPDQAASMEESLFAEFPSVARSLWEQEIARTLEKQGKAGASLDWLAADGVVLPPFLMADDLADLPFVRDLPGAYPFTRGSSTGRLSWNAQYYLQGAGDLSGRMGEAVRRGADGITFAVGDSASGSLYGKGRSAAHVAAAVSGFAPPDDSFRFQFVGDTRSLLDLCGSLPVSGWKGSVLIDPFLEVLLSGDFATDEAALFNELLSAMAHLPDMPLLAVRADLFQNAGATPALELGLTMAAAAEIVQVLIERGLNPLEAMSRVSLFQPAGALYFVEMAKFRATRRLTAMVAAGFGLASFDTVLLRQEAVTSLYNLSIYDAYTNMLRGCTEAMSAILGGAGSLVVLPIDAPFGRDDEFSRRMALNTQLVLRHESALDRVADPAGGAYYIERATDEVAAAAWKVFLEVEADGGYRAALEKGTVQARLSAAGKQRQENLARRKEIQLGVNQYPSTGEILRESEFKDAISRPGVPATGAQKGKYRTIEVGRGPMQFEALRLATEDYSERTGRRPLVQLLPFGSLALQRARAAFIVNFFGCAGFDVNDPGSLDSPEGCVDFAQQMKQKPDAFVLCSSDPDYASVVPGLLPQLRKYGVPVLLAGNPSDAEALKSAGIEDFIHVRLNVYDTLLRYQKRFCP